MKSRNSGYSLVEIIMSVGLIAVIVLTSVQFLVYCNKFVMKSYAKVAAENLARETMETLYKRKYSTLVPGSNYTDQPVTLGVLMKYGGSRTYTINGPYLDPVTKAYYKVITVTVTWN